MNPRLLLTHHTEDEAHARILDDQAAHGLTTSVPPAAQTAPEQAAPAPPRLVVPIVVGTRPEAIKLVPIILALRASATLHPVVVSTGQHHELVEEIFALAGIHTDATLWTGPRRGLNEKVTSVMRRFEDFILEMFDVQPGSDPFAAEDVVTGRYPAAVFVHGDTSSAMAAALAAFHLRIPVMHIEAGLRTGGLNLTPFPEELNRQLISCIACLNFAPTGKNLEALVHENIPVEQIFVTGNTGIDALRWASGLGVMPDDPGLRVLCENDTRFVVVTAHRRESWHTGLSGIAEGVARLARAHEDVTFVVPLHPNPIVREKLGEPLQDIENVLLCEPVSYAPFATLLGRCHFVITDSGGIQEEAPALGRPVLVTRDETERAEGVDAGTLRLVGTDPDVIFAEGDRLLTDELAYAHMSEAENPYGDGHAAQRIVAACEYLIRGGAAPAAFGSGFQRSAVLRATGISPLAPSARALLEAAAAAREDTA